MYSGSQLQQPADVNPLGMPRNKGLATRANGANGAAAGPRRALGDITNASHNAPVDLHKAGDVPHKAFGLASAAPLQHASTHHSMPLASDVDDVMMEPSSEEKRMATDEGGPHSAVVEEMMMSLDLATEVGEMEDLMNVEDEGTAGVARVSASHAHMTSGKTWNGRAHVCLRAVGGARPSSGSIFRVRIDTHMHAINFIHSA